MGQFRRLIAGIEVLSKYTDPDDFGGWEPDHDELFLAGPCPDDLTEDERKVLDDNSWSYDDDSCSWRTFS